MRAVRWHETSLSVRFNEVDPWGIVWHGHYLSYVEIARNALAEEFGLGPTRLVADGYAAPVVDASLKYIRPARYGDVLVVRTVIERPRTAKVQFCYQIDRVTPSGPENLVRATTSQVIVRLGSTAVAGASGVADVSSGELALRFPVELRERLEAAVEAYGVEPGYGWSRL